MLDEQNITIRVGTANVERSVSTNLLGVTIEEGQGWEEHVNSTVKALNKRTSAIRRVAGQIPNKNIIKIVQCLWMSKIVF